MESEGVAGQPLTEAQIATTRRVINELAAYKGWKPERGVTIHEHREATRWGSKTTLCPSNRYPWDEILRHLQPEQEDDTVSNPVWVEWRDRPDSTPYRSYLLFCTPSGLKKALVKNSEEHNSLLATDIAGEGPIALSLAVLKTFAGAPEPDER